MLITKEFIALLIIYFLIVISCFGAFLAATLRCARSIRDAFRLAREDRRRYREKDLERAASIELAEGTADGVSVPAPTLQMMRFMK